MLVNGGHAGAQALHGARQRAGHLLASENILGLGPGGVGGIRIPPTPGERTLELAFELPDAGLRGVLVAIERGAQLDGGALQGGDTALQADAALAHPGEARGERGALFLGVLCGGMCLLGTPLQPVELNTVDTAQAHGGLLGLDAQLLLGVLALLDPAQLTIALGELRGGDLPLVLGLRLTAAQVGEVGLERVDGGFRGLGATCERRVAEPSAAGTPLGEHVELALAREALAGSLAFLRYHRTSEYGRARTVPRPPDPVRRPGLCRAPSSRASS